MTAMSHRSPRRQRGVAALFVTVMLCFAMVLAVAVAHRNVVVEEQRSANELRAAIAFEAAEAGLEWALARVNDPARTGSDCLPSGDATALSLRDRMIRVDVPSGDLTARTWDDGGAATALQAACVRGADGWACSCPASGRSVLPAPAGSAIAPAFVVELAASSRADVIRVVATGCTRTEAGPVCAASRDASNEATARLEAAWALLPALRSAPAAALTVRGDVDVGAASLGVQNVDPGGGALALHAGGRIVAPALRIGAPAGAPLGASLAADDTDLRALAADRFFARTFGMGTTAWAGQPAARRIDCATDCAGAIDVAIAAGTRLLVLDGTATITGPATFGSADDPVVIVASGGLRISGDVGFHGVVHGESIDWNDATPGRAFVNGAVLVAGDYRGNATVDLRRDAAVLARLASGSGSFVRVNGAWKDF
jgi:Tfp pilus assembly protein PilX